MDPVTAREAGSADRPAVGRLRAEAGREAADGRGGGLLLEDLWGDDPVPSDCHTLVGLIDDSVVGYALVERRERRAVIRELFVEPDARRVGVGRAVLAAARDVGRGWGVAVIESQALPGDRATKNFFEAEGMVSRLLVVSRSLEPDAT